MAPAPSPSPCAASLAAWRLSTCSGQGGNGTGAGQRVSEPERVCRSRQKEEGLLQLTEAALMLRAAAAGGACCSRQLPAGHSLPSCHWCSEPAPGPGRHAVCYFA